jgi:hypothetical protein
MRAFASRGSPFSEMGAAVGLPAGSSPACPPPPRFHEASHDPRDAGVAVEVYERSGSEGLPLNRLTTLDADVARALAKFKGTC